MAIVDVMPDHVDAMFDELSKDLAQTTVRQIRNYLYQVFEDARGRRHITFNPVLKPQRRKRAKQKPPQRLNGNQAGILLLTAEQSFYALAWWLIVTLGLRAGEVCGLRRSSFDFEAGTVLIDQEYTDLRGKAHQDSPKNDKIRTLPIPRAMIPRLQLHFHVLTQRAADGTRRGTWKEHQLVFPGKSGKPMNPTSLRHALHDLTDACKLPPVTTHMLRHTAGGFYTSVGAPQEIIGAILGHTPNITGHYAPPPPSAMRPWTDKVYALLSGEVERARRSA